MSVRSDLLLTSVSVAVLASTPAIAATFASDSLPKDLSHLESVQTHISQTPSDAAPSIAGPTVLSTPETIHPIRSVRSEPSVPSSIALPVSSVTLPIRSDPSVPPADTGILLTPDLPNTQPTDTTVQSSTVPPTPVAATPVATTPVATTPVVTTPTPSSTPPENTTASERPIESNSTAASEAITPTSASDLLHPSVMEQVTSVTQLSDVQPSDWAFQALRSLVERYGCLVGYPDGTFRGNRALTRYEFAAALNACLSRVYEIFDAATADAAQATDLEVIQRLQTEFSTELATLNDRVDALEARTAVLEAQSFSTTTILGGEVVLGFADGFGGDPPGDGETNPIFTYTSRLQLVTSFNGRDRLRVELSSGNLGSAGFASESALNSLNALLSFQTDTDNDLTLSQLEYRFSAFNDRVVFTLKPIGFSLSSVLTSNWPYFSDSQGAISRFGQLSPLFRIGNLESGVGLDWLISRQLRFQFGYGSSYRPLFDDNNEFIGDAGAANPDDGFVFGKGGHALGGQLLFAPSNSTQLGLTYIYGYTPDGRLNTFTGSRIADASGFINQPANIHALNLTFQWELSPRIVFAASGGIVGTYAARTNNGAVSTTFMTSLGFRDPFGRQNGDLLGLILGQPLRLVNVADFEGSTGLITDGVASYHAEIFYRFRVNDYLSITPGFFLVTNPGNFEDNNTIFVGALRTSFRF